MHLKGIGIIKTGKKNDNETARTITPACERAKINLSSLKSQFLSREMRHNAWQSDDDQKWTSLETDIGKGRAKERCNMLSSNFKKLCTVCICACNLCCTWINCCRGFLAKRTQNLVISRFCFVWDAWELFKVLRRTRCVIVLLISRFVLLRSPYRRRRGFCKSLTGVLRIGYYHLFVES